MGKVAPVYHMWGRPGALLIVTPLALDDEGAFENVEVPAGEGWICEADRCGSEEEVSRWEPLGRVDVAAGASERVAVGR